MSAAKADLQVLVGDLRVALEDADPIGQVMTPAVWAAVEDLEEAIGRIES